MSNGPSRDTSLALKKARLIAKHYEKTHAVEEEYILAVLRLQRNKSAILSQCHQEMKAALQDLDSPQFKTPPTLPALQSDPETCVPPLVLADPSTVVPAKREPVPMQPHFDPQDPALAENWSFIQRYSMFPQIVPIPSPSPTSPVPPLPPISTLIKSECSSGSSAQSMGRHDPQCPEIIPTRESSCLSSSNMTDYTLVDPFSGHFNNLQPVFPWM